VALTPPALGKAEKPVKAIGRSVSYPQPPDTRAAMFGSLLAIAEGRPVAINRALLKEDGLG
jgi:hypothetical protein